MKKLRIGSRSGLRYFNADDIRSWGPCYDPVKYFDNTVRLNAVKILRDDRIPHGDRLWCVLRTDLMSEKCMRLFAVWCARQTHQWVPNQDPRCIEATNVAERFANGQATDEELAAARSAAWSAAWSAESAAESAAWSAAESAARSAESAAAAAALAARSAESAARSAAESAARSAAESAQREKLIEMTEAEGREHLAQKGKGRSDE